MKRITMVFKGQPRPVNECRACRPTTWINIACLNMYALSPSVEARTHLCSFGLLIEMYNSIVAQHPIHAVK